MTTAKSASLQSGVPDLGDDTNAVDVALARLKKCEKTGITKDYKFRVLQLRQLKLGLKQMEQELNQAVAADLGKGSFVNWMLDIRIVEREIEHALKHLKSWMKDECVDTALMIGPGKSYIQKEPLGIVAVLGTWNFPIATSLGPVVNAISAGNCVLFKPSELAPHSAVVMKSLFQKYLNANAFQCVNGAVQVAIKVTSAPVDLIIFTGSTRTGKLIAQAAAKNLTPCVLELGGKCPVVIDETADMNYTASKIAAMGFVNSGQLCIRSDYILVQNSLAEKFLSKLKAEVTRIYKDGADKASLGRPINDFHKNRCCDLLADHGGTVITGNANASRDKNLTPTIILNPVLDSPVMQDEIFGPILPVLTYKTLDEAIETIKSLDKPLAVYYFGKNSSSNKNLKRLRAETSSGAFLVNEIAVQYFNADTPFGGVGGSGYGRSHGKEGFLQCCNKKSVILKSVWNFWPFTVTVPPYTPDKQRTIKFLMTKMDYTQM